MKDNKTYLCLFKNMFKLSNVDILIIHDNNDDCWYNLDDVALIFKLKKRRIIKIVSKQYIKRYDKINLSKYQSEINTKTLFINNNGLFQLISLDNSIMSQKIWNDITNIILPTLYSNGIYLLPNDSTSLNDLRQKYYEDDILKKYHKRFAIYLAYIGEYANNHLLVFGKTDNLSAFKLATYKKIYREFNVIALWDIVANDLAEYNITKILIENNSTSVFNLIKNKKINEFSLPIPAEINTKNILILNNTRDLNYYKNIISDIVHKTKLLGNDISTLYCGNDNCCLCLNTKNPKFTKEFEQEINILKIKYDVIQNKYNQLKKRYQFDQIYIKRLETEIKNAEQIINDFKKNYSLN
ncbi:BRO family protein [Cotonvirus japonicus]|uniref:BRO family protein n=1 Tax=Cotonvirus japonicus TaxID=2811091 RepID=A0ABM7NRX6_9VIRU|nr:BRO family protein [Cotonvirus japonicus]BCS82856.1 BRO family protein [Cotonvirus japonicus]